MKEILEGYTISQILLAIVAFALATKGCWELVDFFKEKYNKKFHKDVTSLKKEELLEEHYKDCKKQHDEVVEQYNSLNKKLDNVVGSLNELTERVDILTESDMHDIKQSIVKDYHYFTEKQGWIDDFSLEVIESRYKDYKAENGNSFVHTLVEELRALPKHPPAK